MLQVHNIVIHKLQRSYSTYSYYIDCIFHVVQHILVGCFLPEDLYHLNPLAYTALPPFPPKVFVLSS